MYNWAKNEVNIACKKENPNRKEGEWDYGCACYESALKAYKSLCEDGHSGVSFGFTINILNRLMNRLPLTPITEEDWEPNELVNSVSSEQCPRMTSLFKHINDDGTVSYTDVDRCYCVNINSDDTYQNGLCCRILDEMFPITLPYYPSEHKYILYCDEILTDRKNGDFDGKAIYCIKTPDGTRVKVDRYFFAGDGDFKEVSKEEWDEKVKLHNERIKKECEGNA